MSLHLTIKARKPSPSEKPHKICSQFQGNKRQYLGIMGRGYSYLYNLFMHFD